MRFPIKITENFILEPTLHVFGIKPETSYVELNDGTLEVRMGAWFHERFAVTEIARVAPSSWPWWGGLGVKLHHHGVGVIGSADGVVNVQFKNPHKVRAVFNVDATQIWVSVQDSDAFLRALADAARIPVSEPAPFTLGEAKTT